MTNNGNRKPIISPGVAQGIAIVITSVWAGSFIADIFIQEYDPSPFVHFLMMAVAGAIFGHGFLKNGRKGDA